jgi:hypothetical protein
METISAIYDTNKKQIKEGDVVLVLCGFHSLYPENDYALCYEMRKIVLDVDGNSISLSYQGLGNKIEEKSCVCLSQSDQKKLAEKYFNGKILYNQLILDRDNFCSQIWNTHNLPWDTWPSIETKQQD